MSTQRDFTLSLRMLSSTTRQSLRSGSFRTASVMVLPGDFLGLGQRAGTAAESGTEKATILRALRAEGKIPLRADGKPYSAAELGNLDMNTLRILRANVPATAPIWQRRTSHASTTTGDRGLTGLARAIAEHEAGR